MNINELYAVVRDGDKSAEKGLFDLLRERFQLILQHKIMDAADAEDVLQDSLITVARKYRDIDFTISFSAWAHKVLENNILGYYKARGRARGRVEELNEKHYETALINPDPELKRRLLDCLRKINEANIRHARILNFVYQGFDMDQICERLNLTRNGAYILLSRARSKLKECLKIGL